VRTEVSSPGITDSSQARALRQLGEPSVFPEYGGRLGTKLSSQLAWYYGPPVYFSRNEMLQHRFTQEENRLLSRQRPVISAGAPISSRVSGPDGPNLEEVTCLDTTSDKSPTHSANTAGREIFELRSSGRLTGKPHLTACCSDRSRHSAAERGFGDRDRFHSSGKIGLHRAAGFHRIGGRIIVNRECRQWQHSCIQWQHSIATSSNDVLSR
jgi:hypothetical protein